MKALTAILITTAIIAVPIDSGSTATKHKKRYKRAYAPSNYVSDRANATTPQYDIRFVPFGTQQWWMQSERERGGGGAGGDGGGGGGGR